MVIKLCICLVLLVKEFNGLFVSIGNYSNHTIHGLNVPECGLEYVPQKFELSFKRKCFMNTYPNRTIKAIGHMSAFEIGSALSRINLGHDTALGEAPWHVLLHINGSIMCSGALITLEWVLTAAHCVNSLYSGTAFAGSNKRFKGYSAQFNSVFQHNYYVDPDSANMNEDSETVKIIHDIALVKLDKKFARRAYYGHNYLINTICLPERNQMNDYYEEAISTGFGLINQTEYPVVLQKGEIFLIPHNMCSIKQMLCTISSRDDPKICAADSGGPLFQYDEKNLFRAILVGLVKGGTNANCSSTKTTIQYWAAPSRVIDWILDIIESF